jgi:predicted CXXCH cytochrome family protein
MTGRTELGPRGRRVRESLWGAGSALAGLLAVFATLAVTAQDGKPAIPADSTYAKSKVCGMCHKDQLAAWSQTKHAKVEAPADTKTPWIYWTGWERAAGTGSEPGVACEACHGRGKAHVTAKIEDKKLTIINGVKLESPALEVSICAQCHAQYKPKEGEAPVAFTPGEDLLAKVDLLPVVEGGTMQQANELVASKHYEKGTVCETCHSAHTDAGQPHQLRKPVVELCGGCHKDETDLATHTKGKAKPDDTCVTCHMPGGSHAFQKPAGT